MSGSNRRRHQRFTPDIISADVCLVIEGSASLALGRCTLLNLSYGGMCLSAACLFQEGRHYSFVVDLRLPANELLLVKARICWTRRLDDCCIAGIEFTETSGGWLGPDGDTGRRSKAMRDVAVSFAGGRS
jgi:hypothetical protein